MEISTAKEMRKTLEIGLTRLVTDYEQKTGLIVHEIRINKPIMGGESKKFITPYVNLTGD
ncbi:MAG: hypothetical protein KAJ10_16740 [Thermodesulfovibrionia bacterium]|nr:hypothetical protein [Thermodesulfovibrionia bacterium]